MCRGRQRGLKLTLVAVAVIVAVGWWWSTCCTDAVVWAGRIVEVPIEPRIPRIGYLPGVTLTTHLSLSRLEMLVALPRRWPGPIVAVVLLNGEHDGARLSAELRQWDDETAARVRLVPWRRPHHGLDSEYPANFLRNLGLDTVTTRHAFVVDVDFEPSAGLYQRLVGLTGPSEAAVWAGNTVVVVPAFEVAQGHRAMTKAKLLAEIGRGNAKPILEEGVLPRSQTEWNPSHVWFINYPRWYAATRSYHAEVNSFENEPYMMVDLANNCLPYYDERFFYRGGDKQEFTHHLHTLDFRFLVLADHFICHVWHVPSKWRKDIGDRKRALRTNQLVRNILDRRGGWTTAHDRLTGHDPLKLEAYREQYARIAGVRSCGR